MNTLTPAPDATRATTDRTSPGGEQPTPAHRDADGPAIASFIIGLLGTVVFNIVFGPLAVALGTVALARGTRRRGRAALGILLGVADIVTLAALIAAHHNITWNPGL